MGARRPTAADVTVLAEVSRSTVSYILNGSNRQSFPAETVERVTAAATTLGYTPHAAARALRRGQSGVILLALHDLPFGGNLAKLEAALTDAVRASGRSLVTWTVRPGGRLAEVLRDISPEAILEVLPLPEDDHRAARAAQIPIVSIADSTARLDYASGRLQVQYLAGLGHRRLAAVTFSESRITSFVGARLRGVRDTSAQLGLEPVVEMSVPGPDQRSIDRVAEALRGWALQGSVTAVCCFNDLAAGLCVAAADAAGLRVPQDLSVAGVDDDDLSRLLHPHLTTVRYDFTGTAEHVLRLLRSVQQGAPAPTDAPSGGLELVPRASTCPPAGRG